MAQKHKTYPNLFSPFAAGKGKNQLTFKNRVMVGPNSLTTTADFNGVITEEGLNHYESFVNGGFSCLSVPVEIPENACHPRAINLTRKDTFAFQDMHKLVRYAHAFGTKVFMEIYHPGVFMIPEPGKQLMSASPFEFRGQQVREMTEADMDEVANLYADAAFMAQKGGFDGIMLHFGHGWLVSNFISPSTNHRTDQYGGSVENRCRFPKMIIERIREVVDLPIELRLNGTDGVEGGVTPEDAAQQALIFQDVVDMIHFSGGTRLDPIARAETTPTHFYPPAHVREACALCKKAGVTVPIGIVGAVHDPALMEEMLECGDVDYILMGRQAVMEPEWVNKVKEGRLEDIKPCLRCGFCTDIGRRTPGAVRDDSTNDGVCIINPIYSQGLEKLKIPQPKSSKNVAIIGGGIAGMQAAVRACERGHKVTLYEQSDKLGGQLNTFKDYLRFKKEFVTYTNYMCAQVKKSGATILMNTAATPEMIQAGNFDAVIVAIGSDAVVPPIAGVDKANVYQGREAFAKEAELGKKVVIIGGGLIGCELAMHLAEKDFDVTVIEMSDRLAGNALLTERTETVYYMEKAGAKALTGTSCTAIEENGVHIQTKDGEQSFIKADSVILSVGSRPKREESKLFDECAPEVFYVGDCDRAENLRHAVNSAWDAASVIL